MSDYTSKISVVVDPKGAVAGAAMVKKSLLGIQTQASNTLRGISGLQLALGGLAIGTGLRKAVQVIGDFEQSMAGVKAVTGAVGDSFDALSENARALGEQTRFTAGEAAEGMRFLGMAGFETSEILSAMPSMLDLAAAGGLDLARAADIASNAMSQFGLEADDMTRVADVMATTAASANVDIEMLAQSMNYAGNVAASFGIDIETVSAAVGVLGDSGIQAGMAGTQLRSALVALANPTKRAREAIEEMATAINETPDAFDINENSFEDIIRTLSRVREHMGAAFNPIVFDIFDKRSAPGILALTKYTDRLDELISKNRVAEGTAADMADTMNDTLQGAFANLKSAVEGVILNVAEEGSIAAILKDAVFSTADWVRRLDDANGPLESLGEKLADMVETTKDLIEGAKEWGGTGLAAWLGYRIGGIPGAAVAVAGYEGGKSAGQTVQYFSGGQQPGAMQPQTNDWAIDSITQAMSKRMGDMDLPDFSYFGRTTDDFALSITGATNAAEAYANDLIASSGAISQSFIDLSRSPDNIDDTVNPLRNAIDIPTTDYNKIIGAGAAEGTGLSFDPSSIGGLQQFYDSAAQSMLSDSEVAHKRINELMQEGSAILADRPATLDQLKAKEQDILGLIQDKGKYYGESSETMQSLNAVLEQTRLEMGDLTAAGQQYPELLEEASQLLDAQPPTLMDLRDKHGAISRLLEEENGKREINTKRVEGLNLLLGETREKMQDLAREGDVIAQAWDAVVDGVEMYRDRFSGIQDLGWEVSSILNDMEEEITLQLAMDENVDFEAFKNKIEEQIKSLAIEKLISEPIVRGIGKVMEMAGGAIMGGPIGEMAGGALDKLGGIGGPIGDVIGAMIGKEDDTATDRITGSIDDFAGQNVGLLTRIASAMGVSGVGGIGDIFGGELADSKTIPGDLDTDWLLNAGGVMAADNQVFQAKGVDYDPDAPKRADIIYATNAVTSNQDKNTGTLGGIFNGVGSALGGVFNGVGSFLGGTFQGVGSLLSNNLGVVGNIMGTGFDFTGGLLEGGFSALGGIMNTGFGQVVGGLGVVAGAIGAIGAIGDWLQGISSAPSIEKYQSLSPEDQANVRADAREAAAPHMLNNFISGRSHDMGFIGSNMFTTPYGHALMRASWSYANGGYSDSPVYRYYAQGGTTGADDGPLADGGIPSVLHPNEAVVPLPDGRTIPVEINNQPQQNDNRRNVNITINAKDSSDIEKRMRRLFRDGAVLA